MILILLDKQHDLLVTCGDGVASFLECPEELTKGLCVASKAKVLKKIKSTKEPKRAKAGSTATVGDKWRNRSRRYRSSIGSIKSTIILW
jgi:hypothetical protein